MGGFVTKIISSLPDRWAYNRRGFYIPRDPEELISGILRYTYTADEVIKCVAPNKREILVRETEKLAIYDYN